jgi:hypothetical protein
VTRKVEISDVHIVNNNSNNMSALFDCTRLPYSLLVNAVKGEFKWVKNFDQLFVILLIFPAIAAI